MLSLTPKSSRLSTQGPMESQLTPMASQSKEGSYWSETSKSKAKRPLPSRQTGTVATDGKLKFRTCLSQDKTSIVRTMSSPTPKSSATSLSDTAKTLKVKAASLFRPAAANTQTPQSPSPSHKQIAAYRSLLLHRAKPKLSLSRRKNRRSESQFTVLTTTRKT